MDCRAIFSQYGDSATFTFYRCFLPCKGVNGLLCGIFISKKEEDWVFMKKSTLSILVLLVVITLSACGSASKESEAIQSGETDTATSASSETPEDSTWSLDGVFIDDQDNHLILTYYSEDEGMGQYGWTVSAILSDEMYGGFMDEENAALKGNIISYDSEGNEKEKKAVTITQEGLYVVMQTDTEDVYRFTADDTDYTEGMGEILPMFQYDSIYAYSGHVPLWAAAYNYLSFDAIEAVDPEHVLIPYANIVDVDDNDPENVLVYGDYYLWEFEKDDDTFVAVSASHIPGVIHMRQIGDKDDAIYDGLSMDQCLTDDEVEELFGQYYEHYLTLSSDEEMRDAGIAGNIADYIKANDLSVTKYQLYPGSVEELPESFIKVYRESKNLPAYEYPDPSSKEYAIYRYILQSYMEIADTSMTDVTIPYVYIIAEDESDDQDIIVMLTGWISSYNLEDDQLQMQSGGEISGAIHLKKTSDGYEGTSFDEVLDGSEYQKSAKKIFGSHYDDFINLSSDELAKVQKQIISDYVNMNGLSISSYQDMGSEPVSLD